MDLNSLSTDLTQDEVNAWYEPAGAIVLTHTQLDLMLARLVGTFCNLHGSLPAKHLIYTIGAVDKSKIIHAIATTFKSDPFALVPDYKPLPELHSEMKTIASDFDRYSKVRNVVCHGTLGKIDGRLFIGSASAPHFFRNNAGNDAWVYLDEVAQHISGMHETLLRAKTLEERFAAVHSLPSPAG